MNHSHYPVHKVRTFINLLQPNRILILFLFLNGFLEERLIMRNISSQPKIRDDDQILDA